MDHGSADGLSSKGMVGVVVPHGLRLHDPGLGGFRRVWTVGGPLGPVHRCVEGFAWGALSACGSGGLEE